MQLDRNLITEQRNVSENTTNEDVEEARVKLNEVKKAVTEKDTDLALSKLDELSKQLEVERYTKFVEGGVGSFMHNQG